MVFSENFYRVGKPGDLEYNASIASVYKGETGGSRQKQEHGGETKTAMKYITFAIPCYNSEEYMEHAINSILPAGEDVEILVVNDGSKDQTAEIGKRYEAMYPGIVRVIDKENGGHGDAVNAGLSQASGVYFKVVDSDDWVDEEALMKILNKVKEFVRTESVVDMIISNYVYEKVGMEHKKVIHYRNVLPQNEVFRWDDIGSFHLDQYILMHSVIYRTEMLKLCQLKLPKHTFYVDNIYVYYPLPHVRTLYYMDVDFYRYFIGRTDQSVNESVMIGRIDQQLRVTRLMLGYYDATKISNPKLRHYMIQYLEIMMTVCSVLAIKSGTAENLAKKKELWNELKKQNFPLWLRLRWGFLGQGCNLPGKGGRELLILGYKITQKFYGFN